MRGIHILEVLAVSCVASTSAESGLLQKVLGDVLDSSCLSESASSCAGSTDSASGVACVWCEAGAVPSECLPSDMASKLPPSVFHCADAAGKAGAEVDGEAAPRNAMMRDMFTPSLSLQEEERSHDFQLKETLLAAPAMFDEWKKTHGKSYSSVAEERKRFAIFRETLQEVSEHNLRESAGAAPLGVAVGGPPAKGYGLGLNKFSDMSWDEFKDAYLMIHTSSQNCSATHTLGQFQRPDPTQVPQQMDWREQGAVSPVKNQGHCGSCWTFSTTGCLESHHFLKTGDMVLLSEQQLVDCAEAFDNHGCNGGLPSHAFEYVRYNTGLDTEEAYPYDAVGGDCAFIEEGIGATVQRSVNITYKSEEELYEAVGTVGPVSIAFQVAPDFKSFAFGVYDNPTCGTEPEEVNHAVLAVGYGTEGEGGEAGEGTDYWLVKNSWGADWGLDGYFKIARGKNMCGLADCASYPMV